MCIKNNVCVCMYLLNFQLGLEYKFLRTGLSNENSFVSTMYFADVGDKYEFWSAETNAKLIVSDEDGKNVTASCKTDKLEVMTENNWLSVSTSGWQLVVGADGASYLEVYSTHNYYSQVHLY